MFRGNRDHYSIKENSFDPPFRSRFVRVYARTWVNHISMRLEFYGGRACKWYFSSLECGRFPFVPELSVLASHSWYKFDLFLQQERIYHWVSRIVRFETAIWLRHLSGTNIMGHALEDWTLWHVVGTEERGRQRGTTDGNILWLVLPAVCHWSYVKSFWHGKETTESVIGEINWAKNFFSEVHNKAFFKCP